VSKKRNTQEVSDDHPATSLCGGVEQVMSGCGAWRGRHRRSRPSAPSRTRCAWSLARSGCSSGRGTPRPSLVGDGVGSHVIRDGRIATQTIHYTPTPDGD
jgi:hypothetical protein